MPIELKHPGVYIEEVPSAVRPIIGVSTSTTAFVGRARKGPVDKPDCPTTVRSFPEFDRVFGGLWLQSRMSFAVMHFFLNGGSKAVIVRVAPGATAASEGFNVPSPAPGADLDLAASSPGAWGDNLRVTIAQEAAPQTGFSITVRDPADTGGTGAEETFRNLSFDRASPRFVTAVLRERSRLLRVKDNSTTIPQGNPADAADVPLLGGGDGTDLQDADVSGGIDRLATADLNLLCLPPLTEDKGIAAATFQKAAKYCEDRRAFLIVDPPAGADDETDATTYLTGLALPSKNAALFFPTVRAANPLKDNQVEEFAPCGAVAGVFARTDAERGVWKAPAGLEAVIRGVSGPSITLTDGQNGAVNPLGINAIRNMGVAGTVIWGARTLRGADALADQWKYTPVRRTALFIEESLYRGTQWVVFEPNDEPLWSQIRLNLGAFMNRLFRQGAFQGTPPAQAYFVKCDKETTTQDDIDRGVVNILVGFAPLKPAEFVVIRIQQISGQPPA